VYFDEAHDRALGIERATEGADSQDAMNRALGALVSPPVLAHHDLFDLRVEFNDSPPVQAMQGNNTACARKRKGASAGFSVGRGPVFTAGGRQQVGQETERLERQVRANSGVGGSPPRAPRDCAGMRRCAGPAGAG
jgi:hypothetical protein